MIDPFEQDLSMVFLTTDGVSEGPELTVSAMAAQGGPLLTQPLRQKIRDGYRHHYQTNNLSLVDAEEERSSIPMKSIENRQKAVDSEIDVEDGTFFFEPSS